MRKLPVGKIVLTQLANGTAFDFPSPLAPVSVRQFLWQNCTVLSLVSLLVASLATLAVVVVCFLRAEFPGIALILLFTIVLCLAFCLSLNEEAAFRLETYFKLVFDRDFARREAARTCRLIGREHTLIRTTWGGERQDWSREDIGDIHTETSNSKDGVVVSIVLIDSCGLRFVLQSSNLSAFDFLADRMEIASIAIHLRDVLHLPVVRDKTADDAIPLRQPFPQAIRDKTLDVDKERITTVQPSKRFSIFRRVFSPRYGNNQT